MQSDMKQTFEIGGRQCLLYTEGDQQPQALLIQPLGAQERDSIDSEVAMISEATGASFVMAAFAIGDWEVELTRGTTLPFRSVRPWANMRESRSVISQKD